MDSRGSWSDALYGRPCLSPSCGGLGSVFSVTDLR
jgi:hypothetical protein